MNQYRLDPAARVGFVAIRTTKLQKMAAWYRDHLGLDILYESPQRMLLGVLMNRRVLLILEATTVERQELDGGILGLTIDFPALNFVLELAAKLEGDGISLNSWYETGFSRGFDLRDPDGNQLAIEFDFGTRLEPPRGYDFRDAKRKEIKKPELPAPESGRYSLPAGAAVGRLFLKTNELTKTVKYLQNVLGFDLHTRGKKRAYLTTGTSGHHIGVEIQQDPESGPVSSGMSGLHYISIVLPARSDFNLLRMNVASEKWRDVMFDSNRDYLMVTGPNQFMMWFSVA